VLTGQESLDDVLVPYLVAEPGAGELLVLPAGHPSANPAALIGSKAMEKVLHELQGSSDLVVIDSPAALMVSDPMPLIELATGVILVARMNRSTHQRIRRLKKIITAAQGNLFGVVATGATSGLGYDYYRSKYYSTNGSSRFGRRGRATKATSDGAVAESGEQAAEQPTEDREAARAIGSDAGHHESD